MTNLIYFFVAMQVGLLAQCKDNAYYSRNMDPIDPRMWNLPSAEAYDQILEITIDNHSEKVMQSDDAWIVVFHKGKVSRKWRDLARKIGGAVWFGTVDVEKQSELVEKVNLDVKAFSAKTGVAVIYPMRSCKKRDALADRELKSTNDTKEAELLASATIPDRSMDFVFSPDEQQKFNDWIVKGYYYEQPPKFPVICMIEDAETPIHIKVLSHLMSTHFNFASVRKANVPAMREFFKQVPKPQKYPTFLVLLGVEPSSEEMTAGTYNMRFNIVPFIEQKYGDANHIRSLINFLFVVNSDYRKEIPGRLIMEPTQISNMESIRNKLSERIAAAGHPNNGKILKAEL